MLMRFVGMFDEVVVADLGDDHTQYVVRRGEEVDLREVLHPAGVDANGRPRMAHVNHPNIDQVAFGLLCQEANWEPMDGEARDVRHACRMAVWEAAVRAGANPGPAPEREHEPTSAGRKGRAAEPAGPAEEN